MNDSWPFADPPNAAAITQRTILEGGRPILLVVHDEGGEGWQFLDGGEFRAEEALIVALKTIVLFDASISALADLPPGWQARRTAPGTPWVREKSV
jgi:hypothetical protein